MKQMACHYARMERKRYLDGWMGSCTAGVQPKKLQSRYALPAVVSLVIGTEGGEVEKKGRVDR